MASPVRSQSGGAKTIPELRDAFERIEDFSHDLVNGGGSTKDKAGKLASKWREVFGRKLDFKAAEEYLGFISGRGAKGESGTVGIVGSTAAVGDKKRGKTRKAKKMSGGAAPIAGAPLDYQTRPGVDGPYGNFPPYVDGGFGIGVPAISQNYIMTPKLAVTTDTGDGGNRPLQTGGGTKKAKRKLGGGKRRTLRGGSKFILSAAPTTALQDAVTAWRGQTLPTSPDPSSTAFKL
jgi:hypothetical protein